MKLTVQVVVHADEETETTVREAFALQREEPLALDTLGLQLAEAKDLLAAVQDTLVSHQVSTALSAQVRVPGLRGGAATQGQPTPGDADSAGQAASGQPALVALRLPASDETKRSAPWPRYSPELPYLQARFAGLVSYGVSAALLGELFSLRRRLHATALRLQVQATAQRLEDELGDEHTSFIPGCPREWAQLPRPELPLVVGLVLQH